MWITGAASNGFFVTRVTAVGYKQTSRSLTQQARFLEHHAIRNCCRSEVIFGYHGLAGQSPELRPAESRPRLLVAAFLTPMRLLLADGNLWCGGYQLT